MLARLIESLGIPTVTVTMMPELALKMRAPRVVGACVALEEAGAPGYRLDVETEWPVPLEVAYKTWHPPRPSPVVAQMLKSRGQG